MIDLFSRTGLYIIAFKVHRMSVAQAEEFYGPVLEVLMDKLRGRTGESARKALEKEFCDARSPDEVETKLGDLLGPIDRPRKLGADRQVHGRHQARANARPTSATSPARRSASPLVYQGIDAVRKIREVLGPTDPSKAPPGTIRREFGSTIMVNAAHASDSPENAQREMGIVNITENNLKPLIESWYSK